MVTRSEIASVGSPIWVSDAKLTRADSAQFARSAFVISADTGAARPSIQKEPVLNAGMDSALCVFCPLVRDWGRQ